MVKPSKRKASTESTLEFFLLSVKEMVSPVTIDSYKYPTMNSALMVKELIASIELYRKGILHKNSLKSIFEELIYNVSTDCITQEIFGNQATESILAKLSHFKSVLIESNDTNKNSDIDPLLNYMSNLLNSQFLRKTEELIYEIVINHPEKKRDLYAVTRMFVSYLISSPLSEQYVTKLVKDSMAKCEKDIDTKLILNGFFSKLEPTPKIFEVLFRTHEDINLWKDDLKGIGNARIYDRLPKKFSDNMSERMKRDFQKYSGGNYVRIGPTNAKDEFGALKNSRDLLYLYLSAVDFSSHLGFVRIDREAIVARVMRNENLDTRKIILPSNTGRPNETQKLPKNIFHLFEEIFDKTNAYNAFYTILTSVNQHGLATQVDSEESKLITYWSSLESIFEQTGNRGKIETILGHMSSLLTKKYTNKLLLDLYKKIIEESDIQSILSKLPELKGDDFDKFVAITSLKNEKYDKLREELSKKVSKNPLLINRIHLINDLMSSPAKIREAVTQHKKRVEWHLGRMYRNRNVLVHSSNRPDSHILELLNRSLHSYIDIMLNEILEKLSYAKHLNSIGQVILEIDLEVETYIETLKQCRDINPTNYKEYVIMQNNGLFS